MSHAVSWSAGFLIVCSLLISTKWEKKFYQSINFITLSLLIILLGYDMVSIFVKLYWDRLFKLHNILVVPGEKFFHGCYMEKYTNVLPKLERRQVTHW